MVDLTETATILAQSITVQEKILGVTTKEMAQEIVSDHQGDRQEYAAKQLQIVLGLLASAAVDPKTRFSKEQLNVLEEVRQRVNRSWSCLESLDVLQAVKFEQGFWDLTKGAIYDKPNK